MNIIAQISGALATLTNIIGIQLKTKKQILISYIIACSFFVISFYFLKAYSGVITCFIMAIETIINYQFDRKNKTIPKWLIIILLITSLGISSIFYKTWVDLFSILSCIPFIFMLIQKKEKDVRLFTFIFLLFYTTFDILVGAYTAFIGDSLFLVSTIIAIIRYDINMRYDELIKKFKEIEKSTIYFKFKEISSFCIYDKQNYFTLKKIIKNLNKIKEDSIEITVNKNNIIISKILKKNSFISDYDWFIYRPNKKESVDPNIKIIEDREKIIDLLIEQEHELSKRTPEMFDQNGEEMDWEKCGENCIAYFDGDKIISVLTYTVEREDNLHIYLGYTLPEFRSKGIGSLLFNYIKNKAFEDKIETITVCTDSTKSNRVPNMIKKNGFKYFKTGYYKILKEIK